MNVPADFQRLADRADTAVHHVAGGDDVGAGACVRERLLHERLDGLVVDDVAAVVDQPVLAVRGVGIERDVGDHAQLRETLLERTHGALHQAFVIPGGDAIERLGLRRGHREQGECGDAQLAGLFGDLQQFVDRQAFDAGHRAHRRAAGQFMDEDRVDEIVRGQHVFAHEAARELAAAHAAEAGIGKGHGRMIRRAWRAGFAPGQVVGARRRPGGAECIQSTDASCPPPAADGPRLPAVPRRPGAAVLARAAVRRFRSAPPGLGGAVGRAGHGRALVRYRRHRPRRAGAHGWPAAGCR